MVHDAFDFVPERWLALDSAGSAGGSSGTREETDQPSFVDQEINDKDRRSQQLPFGYGAHGKCGSIDRVDRFRRGCLGAGDSAFLLIGLYRYLL